MCRVLSLLLVLFFFLSFKLGLKDACLAFLGRSIQGKTDGHDSVEVYICDGFGRARVDYSLFFFFFSLSLSKAWMYFLTLSFVVLKFAITFSKQQ